VLPPGNFFNLYIAADDFWRIFIDQTIVLYAFTVLCGGVPLIWVLNKTSAHAIAALGHLGSGPSIN